MKIGVHVNVVLGGLLKSIVHSLGQYCRSLVGRVGLGSGVTVYTHSKKKDMQGTAGLCYSMPKDQRSVKTQPQPHSATSQLLQIY